MHTQWISLNVSILGPNSFLPTRVGCPIKTDIDNKEKTYFKKKVFNVKIKLYIFKIYSTRLDIVD